MLLSACQVRAFAASADFPTKKTLAHKIDDNKEFMKDIQKRILAVGLMMMK